MKKSIILSLVGLAALTLMNCRNSQVPAVTIVPEIKAIKDSAQQGIYNDIDGGPSFWPFWDNEGGKSFVRLVNAMDLIDYQKAGNKKKVPVKSPEQAARLKELVSKLNENSNPIVMLVDLK